MKLNFRQGLVICQTDLSLNPTFLLKRSLSGTYIDIIVNPTITTFAHGTSDYVIEENQTIAYAWGVIDNY